MSKRTKLELSSHEVQTLHIALRNSLNNHGYQMIDETPYATTDKRWYSETSHIDNLVRLHVRVNRILLGHKQFNAVIPYTEAPKS